MVYRSEIEFLADANPTLVERNAEEFRRLHQLLDSTDGAFLKAARVDWVSEAQAGYTRRLDEAKDLVDGLSSGFRKAWTGLVDYAEALATAKRHFDDGRSAEQRLSEVMARESTLLSGLTTHGEEPLRQWEDMRDSSGILDRIAELGVDADEIRQDAERHYNLAKNHYEDAQRAESEARSACLADLNAAYGALPEFRGDFGDSAEVLAKLGLLREEARQAADDPYVQLPGSGVKVDTLPSSQDAVVSTTLSRIQALAADFPDAKGIGYLFQSDSEETRRDYIGANSDLIRAAARNSGLPPEMIAGIAWREVEGDPAIVDDVADEVRQLVPGLKDADQTSMGPLAVQVRRGAEILGYDPGHLTDLQRDHVEQAVKDPAQNVLIASEYLAQLKAESSFADVPAEQMTREQMQELAARYNGGPYWESDMAQGYGRAFDEKLDDAKAALG